MCTRCPVSYSCQMQPRALEANPDVAGLGVGLRSLSITPQVTETHPVLCCTQVVIGFLATAYLLVVLLVIYYIFYFDPTLDPFRPKGKTNKKAKYPNPVDIIVVRQIRKLVGRQLVLHPLPADGATEENSTRRLRYETTVNKVHQIQTLDPGLWPATWSTNRSY